MKVGGIDASAGRLSLPETGIWNLHADLVGGKAPTEGAAVEVLVGDLVLAGTVRRAGVYTGSAQVIVIGGADGWGTTVKRRAYGRLDGGVRLAKVADDLAADARGPGASERLTIPAALTQAIVGAYWTRPEGLAVFALDELAAVAGFPWYVGLDGTTRIGARPTVTRSIERLGVDRIDLNFRRATLAVPGDRFSFVAPGVEVISDVFPKVRVLSAQIRLADRQHRVEVTW